MRTASLISVLLTLAVSATAPASAQSAASSSMHPEAREAIDRLWSPYCPGMMLEVCPSPGGQMLRDSIEVMARSGLSADSIVERVLAEYGEEYRAEPRRDGIGGLAWYVPPGAIGVGILSVLVVLSRRRKPAGPTDFDPPSERDEERLRVAMSALDAAERPDF